MNQREREIGARLKEFREGINWSQADFAREVQITRDQLANIEYGRAPIRYRTAWAIRTVFGLSVDWLWGGDMPPDFLSEDDQLPSPSRVNASALLTEVIEEVYGKCDLCPSVRRKSKQAKLDKDDIAHRQILKQFLKTNIDNWMPQVPNGYTADFSQKICELAKLYLSKLPQEPAQIVDARNDALLWEDMRSAVPRRIYGGRRGKIDVDENSLKSNSPAMKSEIERLIQRVKRVALKPGAKAELARELDVAPARISEWLSGVKEPGGEYTLRLLKWVEQRER